ncbi:MAG: hypothetical protein KJN81_05780 [Acidimicrobiia bacterium]|nr:hypothetical protein [Acidimicrobiia bacterium]NNL27923.1 hypothetical protein [Acidimicrobiia bacterium]
MIPKVATVLSAREWESSLVASAQRAATIRLVGRVYQPDEIEAMNVDVVVVGAETSWLSAARLQSWRREGIRVVGIYPRGDTPARSLLELGGADEVLSDDTPADAILRHIRSIPTGRSQRIRKAGQLIVVGGPRGAPGRTEVAVALSLAWSRSASVLLLDLDQDAPSIGIRLGLAPRPDLVDLLDDIRSGRAVDPKSYPRYRDLAVGPGSHRAERYVVPSTHVEELLDATLAAFELVVVDTSPGVHELEFVFKRSDHAVLVSDATAVGLIRTARMVAEWAGPPPALVINRAVGATSEIVRAARKWTGLEPAAIIKQHARIREAAGKADSPDRYLSKPLSRLAIPG